MSLPGFGDLRALLRQRKVLRKQGSLRQTPDERAAGLAAAEEKRARKAKKLERLVRKGALSGSV